MINLFLAVLWLMLGVVLLANPWNNPDRRQEYTGWFCLAVATYNVISWRFQVRARRRAKEWQVEDYDEPVPPKVKDPTFDFSDEDKDKRGT